MIKVELHKGQLNYFRKLARNTSLEVHAYLLGEIISPDMVVVDAFAYPRKYAIQKNNEVCWSVEEYNELQRYVEKDNKRIVGYIHSHPSWDAVPSPADYDACIVDGLRLCGIVSVYGRKTRVRFWVPESALPCEIKLK